MKTELSEKEQACLNHHCRWGSDGYPVVKRGHKWFVDGYQGLGSFPISFITKTEASVQWEKYIDLLLDKSAGRI